MVEKKQNTRYSIWIKETGGQEYRYSKTFSSKQNALKYGEKKFEGIPSVNWVVSKENPFIKEYTSPNHIPTPETNTRWYIWFERFENGYPRGAGVLTKSYAHKSSTTNYARKHFEGLDMFKWVVSQTNPFTEVIK